MSFPSFSASKPHSPSSEKESNEQTGWSPRIRLIWIVIVAFYVLVIGVLALLGQYGFVWKTVVIPSVVLVAILTRRLRAFVRDWALFVVLVGLFDVIRGFIFAVITRFELPVYMTYVIDAERWLLGGQTLPIIMQGAWYNGVGWFERSLIVIHASHFVTFFLIGLLVWLARPDEFKRFKLGILMVLSVGILLYLAVPTVPPWMAYQFFDVLPRVHHVTAEVYNLVIPSLQKTFDTNPVAAMPSLHTALPVFLSLISIHHFKWRGLPVVVYTLLVILGITYLGEHYLLDVVAGMVLAGVAYYASHHVNWWKKTSSESSEQSFRLIILASFLVFLISQGVGLLTAELRQPFLPNEAFITRELKGRSTLADYHEGTLAFSVDFANGRGASAGLRCNP